MPCRATGTLANASVPPRLAEDVAGLIGDGVSVEVIEEHPRYFVVVRGFVLPRPYEPQVTDLMVMADYQFPQSALDMFWTDPHVTIGGVLPQNADQFAQFLGRNWQRWSWHYTWNPLVHDLRSHIEVFHDRLERAA